MNSQNDRTLFYLAAGLAAGSLLTYLLRQSAAGAATSTLDTQATAPASPLIANGLDDAIGNTPLIRIKSLSDATGCEILGKAEFLNPGGSPKDRVALAILKQGEAAGLLVPGRGDVVYEGTVGSTGISLAWLCRARGYTAHIVMPDDQAAEKASLLQSLGAIVERVRPASIVDRGQFVNRARALAAAHSADPTRPGQGLFADQFETEANWQAHYAGTAVEILAQTQGKMDAFVAGAGTGGTLTGIARRLKPAIPGLQIVLADPQGSGLFNKVQQGVLFADTEREGTRRRSQVDTVVEGIGLNRLTRNFAAGLPLLDQAIRVTDREAVAMSQYLMQHDGLFLGSSSAVNCVAAVRMAEQMGPGHRIVTILCDPGTRHLSKFHNTAYLASHDLTSEASLRFDGRRMVFPW
ncbi:OAS-TL 2 protein [Protomyces lactucae-debilis]|uniref:cysteine synthase n=1 Tax=Protomyces lactucae-debilis TaxID=2754530 RepID=A0A1Y2F8V0_PROLT|nr:OAS-TL 2 protein [Protomyces lactucae-debilis]ORY80342.1 OAS-TL 2 protein [Protomyces lactucae-debilis]